MSKKTRRDDEIVVRLALKLAAMLALAVIIAAGIDLSHAAHAFTQYYG